jgi:hypothetical protein
MRLSTRLGSSGVIGRQSLGDNGTPQERICVNLRNPWTRNESGNQKCRRKSAEICAICGKQRLIGFVFIDRDDFEIVARGF